MRHLKHGNRLGMTDSRRRAVLRNLVTDLMRFGRVRTTDARAKELRRLAERIITLSRRVPPSQLAGLDGPELAEARARRVHAIRLARRYIEDREVLERVFGEYSARYESRPGGYTRIFKLGRRPGDQASMSLIELVTEPYPPGSEAAAEPAEPSSEPEAPVEQVEPAGGV